MKGSYFVQCKMFVRIITLLLFLIGFLSCIMDQKIDPRLLSIENKTNEGIFYFESQNDTINYIFKEEDVKRDSTVILERLIKRNESQGLDCLGSWERHIEKCSNKKLKIFIIKNSLVEKYGWNNIIRKKLYSRKYSLDLSTIEQKEWTLIVK